MLVIPAVLVLAALAVLVWSLLRPEPTADELVAELERALARSGRPLADGVTLAALEHRFRARPTPPPTSGRCA